MIADEDAAPVPAHERIVTGKLMVQPASHEPRPQNQRRVDGEERLVEIRRVLVAEKMYRRRVEPCARFRVDRVEIADHRVRHMAHRQRPARRPVTADEIRRDRQQFGNRPRGKLAASQKGDFFQIG